MRQAANQAIFTEPGRLGVIYEGLVWSNPSASRQVYLRNALLKPRFHTLLEMALEVGLGQLKHEWELLSAEGSQEAMRASPTVDRILRHIEEGFAHVKAGDRTNLGPH